MPFQINVEKEIFKNNWFSLLFGIRQCLNGSLQKKRQSMHGGGGGEGGWRLCKHSAVPIYPGCEAVSVSDIDCRLESAYSLINKGKCVSKSQFHSKS